MREFWGPGKILQQILLLSAFGLVVCTYILVAESKSDPTFAKTQPPDPLEAFSIYYPKGKAWIPDPDQKRLQKMAEFLVENPGVEIRIESHALGEGKATEELLLSEKRSLEISRFLQIHGVPHLRIRRFFYGSAKPVPAVEPELNRFSRISLLR